MRILAHSVAVVVVAVASMIGSVASAQAVSPVAARYNAAAGSNAVSRATFVSGGESDVDQPARIGLGLAGGFGGAWAGAAMGAQSAKGCHGEFCEIGNVLAGAAIGSVVTATLLSAIPGMSSTCTMAEREVHALGWSVVGAVTGGAIGLVGGPLSVLTYIVGSAIGAGIGAARC